MNAAYRPRDPPARRLYLASDMQWGDAPGVAGAALSFVSLMNALDIAPRAPEFVVMAGDIVDGQFGSALTLWSKLFGARKITNPRFFASVVGAGGVARADIPGAGKS